MKFEDLRGWMGGEDCVVVGCGPSADLVVGGAVQGRLQVAMDDHWTIGCNRAMESGFQDFALCVEPYRDRTVWEVITAASPMFVFTHLSETPSGRKAHPRSVEISRNVNEWWPDLFGDVAVPLRLSESSFFAAAVALWLGFETVGLIGVDLSPPRFGDDQVRRSNKQWQRLDWLADQLHVRIINLSPESRLTVMAQGTWDEVRTKNTKRGAEWDKARVKK